MVVVDPIDSNLCCRVLHLSGLPTQIDPQQSQIVLHHFDQLLDVNPRAYRCKISTDLIREALLAILAPGLLLRLLPKCWALRVQRSFLLDEKILH